MRRADTGVIESELVGDKIQLRRGEADKRPLLQRLSRIEGQVRGLHRMIDEDRYCLDEIQQINAITAALREVALAIIAQHVEVGVGVARRSETPDDVAVADVMRVLRGAMRLDGRACAAASLPREAGGGPASPADEPGHHAGRPP